MQTTDIHKEHSSLFRGTITFSTLLRLFVGFIFMLSALTKAFSFHSFPEEIQHIGSAFFSLSQGPAFILAIVILIIEALTGFMLLIKKTIYFLPLALLMSIGFCVVNLYRIITDAGQECHCFGDMISMNVVYSLALDIILVLSISKLLSSTEIMLTASVQAQKSKDSNVLS